MELWKKQIIRRLFHYSSKNIPDETAFLIKHDFIPKHLYKYRFFNERSLDSMERDYLFMCSPDKFNDPYDTAVYFDSGRFSVENSTPEEIRREVERMERERKENGTYVPAPIKNPIRSNDLIRKVASELLTGPEAHKLESVLEALEHAHDKINEDMVRRMTAWFRSGYGVLCLSENPTSVLMWSHYANNHKGFCIEYDFAALPPDSLRRRLCFPVFYRRKLTDATRYMMRQNIHGQNVFFGVFMSLLKSDEWAYEKEWRIVHPAGPEHANMELSMPKPSSIILGISVPEKDEVAMREICARKKIPLKRMVQKHNQFRLDVGSEILH